MQTYYACLIFSVCTLSLWSLGYTLDYKQLFPCCWNETFHPIDIDQGGLLSLKLFALSFSAPTVHPTHTQSLPNGPTCGLGPVSSFSCYTFMLLLCNCPIPSPWGLLKPLLHSWVALQPLLLNYQTRPALGCVRHYQAFPLFSHLHFSTLLEVPWVKHICNMTTLLPNLTPVLFTIANAQGQDPAWVNVFTVLWLYLEVDKDQFDTANAKTLQLKSEVNQLTSKLNTVSQSLAMALARPAASSSLGAVPQAPELSKIFTDPGMYVQWFQG